MPDYTARRLMMVDTQVRPEDVTKFPIIDAMLRVPREDFVPAALRETAYAGDNIALGDGRVMLEPRTLAKMLDALDIEPDEMVLDIGCGQGYSSAVIAHLAETVVAQEEHEDFARDAQDALSEFGADNVVVNIAPLTAGAPEHAPFDVIVFQGGITHLPDAIFEQLKDGGRVAALFVDGALGELRVGYKLDGHMTWRRAFSAGAPVLPGFEKHSAFTL
ncbi:MAG: protein-L-isoaspartate O-methyltransferase [Pseudomonadota bacterium]